MQALLAGQLKQLLLPIEAQLRRLTLRLDRVEQHLGLEELREENDGVE